MKSERLSYLYAQKRRVAFAIEVKEAFEFVATPEDLQDLMDELSDIPSECFNGDEWELEIEELKRYRKMINKLIAQELNRLLALGQLSVKWKGGKFFEL